MEADVQEEERGDAELVRAAQDGDLDAYGRIVMRYQSAVRAFAAVRIPMADEAEDLAQDAFVIAWRKLGAFDAATPLGPWLRTIINHLVLNHRRKFRAEGVGGHIELEELLGRLPADKASERLEALRRCLSRMDGPSRGLLEERYFEETSVKEISQRTGRGYSALTMQLHRLRELLAACIREEISSEGRTK